MNVPKISLKSTIDKSQNDSSTKITNQININTRSAPDMPSEVKAEYKASSMLSRDPSDQYIPRGISESQSTVEPERLVINPYSDLATYANVSVSGQELDVLIRLNKELKAQNLASEIIIEMMKNNPVYVSSLILTDDVKLSELVKILTDAETVTIDSEVLFTGCCSAYEYRKVNAIYILKGGQTLNLKYDFPEVTKRLKDLGINSKFVF